MSKSRSAVKGSAENDPVQSVSEYTSSWYQAPGNWGHSLHSISPYVGSFPPELAHFFIRKYTKPGDTVLDPFAGRGTTPLEASLHNRKALASDKFSYAACLAKAKCNPIPDSEFRSYLDTKLTEARSVPHDISDLLENEDLLTFFSEYTLSKILRLQKVLEEDHSPEAIYLNAIVCGILHGPNDRYLSLQTKDTYSGTKSYVERYAERNNLTRPERDLRPRIIDNHELAQEDYIPPWLPKNTSVHQSGSRNLPFNTNQADLVLTSPPYLHKLDYTWNNWIRLWWLGEDRKSEQNDLDMTQDLTAYRKFIRDSLTEMDRVLTNDAVAVLVVGDVIKRLANRNEVINIANLIRDEAVENTAFEHRNTIVDDYGVDGRSYLTASKTKHEYTDEKHNDLATVDRCLILTKGDPNVSREPIINWNVELYKEPI